MMQNPPWSSSPLLITNALGTTMRSVHPFDPQSKQPSILIRPTLGHAIHGYTVLQCRSRHSRPSDPINAIIFLHLKTTHQNLFVSLLSFCQLLLSFHTLVHLTWPAGHEWVHPILSLPEGSRRQVNHAGESLWYKQSSLNSGEPSVSSRVSK